MKEYYDKYKYSNASTEDFIRVCELISGRDLGWFFKQWVYNGTGLLKLEYNWECKKAGDLFETEIILQQVQAEDELYDFSIDVNFYTENENNVSKRFFVHKKNQELVFHSDKIIKNVILDNDGWLFTSINMKTDIP
jgi:aminopeptidase N